MEFIFTTCPNAVLPVLSTWKSRGRLVYVTGETCFQRHTGPRCFLGGRGRAGFAPPGAACTASGG